MGWMVELYPLTFTILVGGWVVFDNYRKQLDISIVKYVMSCQLICFSEKVCKCSQRKKSGK
jgi:hypothetical protein